MKIRYIYNGYVNICYSVTFEAYLDNHQGDEILGVFKKSVLCEEDQRLLQRGIPLTWILIVDEDDEMGCASLLSIPKHPPLTEHQLDINKNTLYRLMKNKVWA